MKTEKIQKRPVYEIAKEIRKNWQKVSPYAAPYLDAMSQINSIDENYFCDSAQSVVLYFLSNAAGFKGEKAKELKKELKALCGLK